MENKKDMIYAGFWVRVLASVIDGLILSIPLVTVESLFGETSTITIILFVLIWWQYGARMLSSSWKATIGKKIVGIEVVDEIGEKISFKVATLRYLYSIISYLLILPTLMMLFSEKKQTLHDKMAKTIVLDSAQMGEGSRYSNIQFLRVIGYIILAILSAAKIYTIGMFIFFYLLISIGNSGQTNTNTMTSFQEYNNTNPIKSIKKIELIDNNKRKIKSIAKRTFSSKEKKLWETAKSGKSYGIGYYENMNLNIQNEKGQTPVMIAVENGHSSVIQDFSEGIMDLTIKDYEGETAFDYMKKPTNRTEELSSNQMLGALKMAEAAQIFRDKAYIAAIGYKNDTRIIRVKIIDAECSDFNLPKHIQCKD